MTTSIYYVIICAAAMGFWNVLVSNYFALRAYNQGMPVSIGGPIIIGGSIVLVSVAGFMMGDKISFLKLISILMIIAGASTLAGLSR
jgi:multidrug transporter EmrE-like cation transporter